MSFANQIAQLQVTAAANIEPCRIIRFTAPGVVNITTANSQEPLGITREWSFDPPGLPGSLTAVVKTGGAVPYASEGMQERCIVGVGGVTGGTRVCSDATGQIVAFTAGAGKWSVGWATETCIAGEFCLVTVSIKQIEA